MQQVLDRSRAKQLAKAGGKRGPRDTAEPGETGYGPAMRYVSVHRRESARRYRIGKGSEQTCILLVLIRVGQAPLVCGAAKYLH